MLIHGNESSKREGVDLVNHDAVSWPVSSEFLVRSNPLNLGLTLASLLQLGHHLRSQEGGGKVFAWLKYLLSHLRFDPQIVSNGRQTACVFKYWIKITPHLRSILSPHKGFRLSQEVG